MAYALGLCKAIRVIVSFIIDRPIVTAAESKREKSMSNTINLQYPVIRSTKPDGTVEYKPLATTDSPDDAILNIFLPREGNSEYIFHGVTQQGISSGATRA